MSEDLGDHGGVFDGGDDLQRAATLWTLFNIDIMILVAITNRASYPRCKTLIEHLGERAKVLLMNPGPDIKLELAGQDRRRVAG